MPQRPFHSPHPPAARNRPNSLTASKTRASLLAETPAEEGG